VKRLTGGRGVHVVYDSVGKTTFLPGLDVLVPRGMMVSFGQSSGPIGQMDPLLLNQKGSLFLTRPTLAHYIASRDDLLTRSGELFEWIGRGELDVRIGAEFSLSQAAEAHRALEGRRTTGKVLLRI
jgi:NADPH2:quinone reductase